MRALALLAFGLTSLASAQTTVTIESDIDNTIYDSGGNISNGQSDFVFTGRTGGGIVRRGLYHFDVASAVPAGSIVQSVSLELTMLQTSAGPQTTTMHRVLQSWGEGSSTASGNEGMGGPAQANDATWDFRFFPGSPWTTMGGDFVSGASATQSVDAVGTYQFGPSAGLAADVQAWILDPADNHGWILLGNEGTNQTTKRFGSHENPTVANRPRLTITYVPSGCPTLVEPQQVVRLGSPPNPNALLPGVTSEPRLGSIWDPVVDHTTFLPNATIDVLLIGASSVNVPAPFGTLLVDQVPPSQVLASFAGTPFSIVIPNDCSLLGLQRFAQGGSLAPGGVAAATNALDVTVGNF